MKESQDDKKQLGRNASLPACERVEDRIHELMDLRQPLLSDELVRQHVCECDACAELIVDFGALNDSLSQIPIATLHRLSSLQHAESEPKNSMRLHPISFVASIACLLLVMLTAGTWFSPAKQATIETPVEAAPSDLAVVEEVPTLREYVSTGFSDQSLMFLATAHKTSNPTELINAVSFEQLSGGVESFQDVIDMTADLPGIRPVTKSVNATLHLIRVISETPPASKREEPTNSPDVGCYDGSFLQLCSV